MKYIRTKDGKIFDLNKIKKQIKENGIYPHLYDWKLTPTNDSRGALDLSWKADFKGSDVKPEGLETPSIYSVVLNCESSEYRKAKNIEELIQDNDILYIHDLYPDAVLVVEGKIKPFGYGEAIKLEDWLKYKLKFDLYVKQGNDYIKTAETNKKGELELL